MDDCLVSTPTAEETAKLARDTQAALATANLRLHKVVFNSVTVMKAFPTGDLSKDIRSLDLRHDKLSAKRSFGVFWDMEGDVFTSKVSVPDIPFTRSGVLSLVNSIYDPFGLAAPVLLESRLLIQELVAMGKASTAYPRLGWHDPLPDKLTDDAQFVLSLAASWYRTSTPKGDGGEFSTWVTNFGPDGDGSISTICRREWSGTSSVGT